VEVWGRGYLCSRRARFKLMSFDPATLFANGEVGAWYELRDISTLFQDEEGTIPVTADGQTVSRILDKSGNGNHATQSVSRKRPTYRDVGGVQWLEIDQVDDKIIIPYQLNGVNTLGISYLPDAAQTSFLLVDSQQANPWGITGAEGDSSTSVNNTNNEVNRGLNAIRWDSIGSTISVLKRNDLYNSYASSNVVLAELDFANWPSVFSYGKYFTSSLSGFTKTTGYIMVEGFLDEQTSLGLEEYLTALTVPAVEPLTAAGAITLPSLVFQGNATAEQVTIDFTIQIDNSIKIVQIDVSNKILETTPNRFTIRI